MCGRHAEEWAIENHFRSDYLTVAVEHNILLLGDLPNENIDEPFSDEEESGSGDDSEDEVEANGSGGDGETGQGIVPFAPASMTLTLSQPAAHMPRAMLTRPLVHLLALAQLAGLSPWHGVDVDWLEEMAAADGNGGGKGERKTAAGAKAASKVVDLAEKLEPKAATRKMGTAGIYKDVNGTPTPVSDGVHYAYRDRRLYSYNAVEFDLLFEVQRVDEKEMAEFVQACENREAGASIVCVLSAATILRSATSLHATADPT
jgi:hypothetical protein